MNEHNITYKELIQTEITKCVADPSYFIKKYCVIQHPTRGKVPFILYDFQEDCLYNFAHDRYNIILKSRQLGLSTLVAAYCCWLMVFFADKNILVLATKKDTAKNLVTKIRIMFQGLPKWISGSLNSIPTEDNKLSLALSNGSQVKAVASSPDSGRSEALSLLVLDEAAFIDKIDQIWAAAYSTLSTGGDCIVLSTPNGVGNWFHDMWLRSKSGENGFNNILLPWTVHPDRDQSWRDEQTRVLGVRKARQECDCDFLASGHNVIDLDIIKFYEDTFIKEPIEKRGIDKEYWIWEYPIPGKTYIVAADVARGDGRDKSAAVVFELESMRQVAEYNGKLTPKEFGGQLFLIASEYNNALLVVERENVGWNTVQELIDRAYPQLFYMSADFKYIDVHRQLSSIFNEKKLVPGFSTNSKTRPLLISKMEQYLEDQSVIIQSQRLINELYTFIWINRKEQAMPGKTDDIVMAFAICLWVRDTALKLIQEGQDIVRMTLDKFKVTKHPGLYVVRRTNEQERAWKWGGADKGNENLKDWL